MNIDTLCMRCMKGTLHNGICQSCGANISEYRISHALPLKSILNGRYLIGAVLGTGGFGITYAAYDLHKNERAAIKEYMPLDLAVRKNDKYTIRAIDSSGWYEKGRERFEQEAQFIYRYRMNPNIVQVNQLFREHQTAYYVMEYLQGSDLGHLISSSGGKITWEQLLPYLEPVMSVLEMVHNDGVIHRDISPDNIYITDDGTVKLIDFGSAREYLSHNSKSIVLKRGYAPPEQYMYHGNQGPWTDIYALAGTIYYCLTGICPPEAPARVDKDTLVSPSSLSVSMPKHAEEALMKALRLRIDERYQNVMDFKRDLIKAEQKGRVFLKGIGGKYLGWSFPLRDELKLGRDVSCEVQFPNGEAGVSRIHCRILLDAKNSAAYIMDMNSTYGTNVNGSRLTPGYWYPVHPGDRILIGRDNQFTLSG